MNVAMIMAGGVGNRMGANIPKQYIKIHGKPIIVYTLEIFEKSQDVDAIEVVCAAKWIPYVEELCKEYCISKLKWIAEGGETCQDSIRHGIFNLRDKISQNDNLMIHMSVSPFVSLETIHNGFSVSQEKGNAFAARPCLFCLCKKTNEEWSNENAYKEEYVQLNMPWVINYGTVLNLYTDALEKSIGCDLKDYLPSLMYSYGMKTYFFEDNDRNFLKITTKSDLELFEAFLKIDEESK